MGLRLSPARHLPPDPKFGTLEELQEAGRVCDSHKVPWGLHDNYVDIYPDCEGFTYDLVSFNENGQPRKAWYNPGRDAQSYSWRPDLFEPFLKRNLKLIKENLHPSASFVDVFSSSNGFDFYDRKGNFHSKLETRRWWGQAFDTIRNTAGNHAPTSSEAGSDHLIGHLDGADCQLLRLTPNPSGMPPGCSAPIGRAFPGSMRSNHARFILHGVGYSNRYEGGRSRNSHGIESDGLYQQRILTGHALMIDAGAFGRGAVRKYWLARTLFAPSPWTTSTASSSRTATFIASRSAGNGADWCTSTAARKTGRSAARCCRSTAMPPRTATGKIQSSIERRDGVIVEQSRGPKQFYVDGRGFDPNPQLKIQPVAKRVITSATASSSCWSIGTWPSRRRRI